MLVKINQFWSQWGCTLYALPSRVIAVMKSPILLGLTKHKSHGLKPLGTPFLIFTFLSIFYPQYNNNYNNDNYNNNPATIQRLNLVFVDVWLTLSYTKFHQNQPRTSVGKNTETLHCQVGQTDRRRVKQTLFLVLP